MKLHELKDMVKVEFDKFLKEEEETGAEDVEISVDGEEGGDEDVLRQIYDLLATHFEGGEGEADMEDMEDMEDLEDIGDAEGEEEVEDEEEDEEDLEEAASTGYGDKGGSKKAWYKEGKKSKKKDVLQERFQKLANII
jgi:hypothetical protein